MNKFSVAPCEIRDPCPIKNNVVECKMENGAAKCTSSACLPKFVPIDNTDFMKGCRDPCTVEGVCSVQGTIGTCTADDAGVPQCTYQCQPGFRPSGATAATGCVGRSLNFFDKKILIQILLNRRPAERINVNKSD